MRQYDVYLDQAGVLNTQIKGINLLVTKRNWKALDSAWEFIWVRIQNSEKGSYERKHIYSCQHSSTSSSSESSCALMTLASSSVSGWWETNIMTWKRGKGHRLERNVLDFRFPDESCVTCSARCYMRKLRPGKGEWCTLDHTPNKMAVAQLVKNLPAMQETLVWFLEDLSGRSAGEG